MAAVDARPRVAYRLPEALRRELATPFGPVLSTDELRAHLKPGDVVVAVGDVVSFTMKQLGVTPWLFVCDYQTQRGRPEPLFELELGSWGRLAFRVRNPAAQVTREAWDAIRLGLEHAAEGDAPVRIVVEGEEDLLGLPCFLEAPEGAKVLYGIPGQGVAVVEVTPAFQEKVRALLARFEQA